MEKHVYYTDYAIYQHVWIADRYDTKNKCSQYGTGDSNDADIVIVPRECTISSIVIHDASGKHLYYVLPLKISDSEADGSHSHYFEKGRYADEIFGTKEDCIEYIQDAYGLRFDGSIDELVS